MPMIEPPKFTGGELHLNTPSPKGNKSSSSSSSFFGSGMRYNMKQASQLLDQHHNNSMELLDHSYTLQTNYDEGVHRRNMEAQAVTHEQSKDLETHRAGLAADTINLQHNNAIAAATHAGKLENKMAAKNHKRTLELHNAINASAQAGTELNLNFPHGGSASYTKAGSAPAAAAPVAKEEPATEAPKKDLPEAGSSGWVQPTGKFKRLNKKVNLVSKPSPVKEEVKPAAPAKSGPAVTRDPKTGRAVSLKKK